MTKKEFVDLTTEIRELIKNKREPTSESDFCFLQGYQDQIMELTLIKSYAQLMKEKPTINIKCLHAFILGFSTAETLAEKLDLANDKKTTYH